MLKGHMMKHDLSVNSHGLYKIKGMAGLPQWTYHSTSEFYFSGHDWNYQR